MTLRTALLAATAGICLVGSASAQQQQSVLDRPEVRQLSDQDIDPNAELMEALRLAARKGPIFRVSPSVVSFEFEVGKSGSTTVRLTNAGDEVGSIQGINAVGAFEGLVVESDCGIELEPGRFCEVDVSYQSDRARTLETVLVGSINERNRKSLDIPVRIEVERPPAPEPVIEPTPLPVVTPQPVLPAKPKGPTSSDIARRYFSAQGGSSLPAARNSGGFTVISKRDPQRDESFAGVAYSDMRIESVRTEERYDREIPSTQASLPVDRDRILTADRVIKAVLETPVSNVMCAKAVAVVESDVYSATSKVPLIQAGSRVIGECQDFVDERSGISWTRIITTDGRSITFDEMNADTNDAMGQGGALGREYQSPFDRYVLPVFSTMIDTAAGVIFASFGEDEEVTVDANGNVVQSSSAKNEGIRIITGEARTTAQEIIKDIRDVRKVVVVPAGSRIDIEIREDVYFRDDKKVVRLADMSFDLEDITAGEAQRDIPESIVLSPAEKGYEGPVVMIDGRPFKMTERATGDEEEGGRFSLSSINTEATLSDIASSTE